MSTAALTNAQSSDQKLADDYRDALIVDSDGSVRRIERIDVLGPAGATGLRKLLSSLLTKTKVISVTLSEPLALPLADLKAHLIACISSGGYFIDPDADETERQRIVAAIQAAPDALALFHTFKLPLPEDSLDGL